MPNLYILTGYNGAGKTSVTLTESGVFVGSPCCADRYIYGNNSINTS